MDCGNGNRMAGVVGQEGQAGTVLDWDGWRGGAGGTGGRKYQKVIYGSWVFDGVLKFLQGGRVERQGVVQLTCPIRFRTYNIRNVQNRGL